MKRKVPGQKVYIRRRNMIMFAFGFDSIGLLSARWVLVRPI
jgi:hypothetical protein